MSVANHKYHFGEYKAHVYVKGGNGLERSRAMDNIRVKQPTAEIGLKDKTGEQKVFEIQISNPGVFGDIREVRFAVWSDANGQDDLKWITGTSKGDGVWGIEAVISEYRSYGKYNADVYGTLADGSQLCIGHTEFTVEEPTWDMAVENQDDEKGTFDIVISNIESKSGVSQVRVPVWCAEDQNDIRWYDATRQSDGSYRVTVNIKNHQNHTGEYKIHVYLYDGNGFFRSRACENVYVTPKTSINGNPNVTVSQMVNWFNDNNSNFDKFTKYSNGEYDGVYKNAGINSIEDFCQIYYEEAMAEGIRVDVAFSQAMLETGFLTYGGQVKPSQFNFAGLGATDNGASGASFNSVREGIRAHIQHLKCYSSTEPLVNECVDPRWNESLRGKAIYVEYLSIPNNPYNVGWATDKNYSKKILNLMEMLINTNV